MNCLPLQMQMVRCKQHPIHESRQSLQAMVSHEWLSFALVCHGQSGHLAPQICFLQNPQCVKVFARLRNGSLCPQGTTHQSTYAQYSGQHKIVKGSIV